MNLMWMNVFAYIWLLYGFYTSGARAVKICWIIYLFIFLFLWKYTAGITTSGESERKLRQQITCMNNRMYDWTVCVRARNHFFSALSFICFHFRVKNSRFLEHKGSMSAFPVMKMKNKKYSVNKFESNWLMPDERGMKKHWKHCQVLRDKSEERKPESKSDEKNTHEHSQMHNVFTNGDAIENFPMKLLNLHVFIPKNSIHTVTSHNEFHNCLKFEMQWQRSPSSVGSNTVAKWWIDLVTEKMTSGRSI